RDAPEARELQHVHGGDGRQGLLGGRSAAFRMGAQRHRGHAEFPMAPPRQYRHPRCGPVYRVRRLLDEEHRTIPCTRKGRGWQYQPACAVDPAPDETWKGRRLSAAPSRISADRSGTVLCFYLGYSMPTSELI